MPRGGWLMGSAAGVSVFCFGYIPLPDVVPSDRALFEALRTTHYILSRLLIAVLTLHVAAVVHHDLLRRDGVFRRMWPLGGTCCAPGRCSYSCSSPRPRSPDRRTPGPSIRPRVRSLSPRPNSAPSSTAR